MSDELDVTNQHSRSVHVTEARPRCNVRRCDDNHQPTCARLWPERLGGDDCADHKRHIDYVNKREHIIIDVIGISLSVVVSVEKLQSINNLPPLQARESDTESCENGGECFYNLNGLIARAVKSRSRTTPRNGDHLRFR